MADSSPQSSIFYPRSSILHPPSSILLTRRGFSFAEVMFAVVILGIGFIMVAAIFPVAIQQTQSNGEDNTAAALARQAANSISQTFAVSTMPNLVYSAANATPQYPSTTVQNQLLFPPTVKNYAKGSDTNAVVPTGIVVPFNGNRWDQIKMNLILPSDPRYAYVPFYKRDSGSSVAQIIVVTVGIRNRSTYDVTDDVQSFPKAILGRPDASVVTTVGTATAAAQTTIGPDILSLTTGSGLASEGAVIRIPSYGADRSTFVPPSPAPEGRYYTLGRSISFGKYELMPGDSMELTAGTNGWGTTGGITDHVCTETPGYVYQPATLQPTVAYATLQATPTSPNGLITIYSVPYCPVNESGSYGAPANAVPGAFVIIADDFPYNPGVSTPTSYQIPDNIVPTAPAISPSYSVGSLNGRIFRLGAAAPVSANGVRPVILPGTFNLDPAYGMRPTPAGGTYSPDTIPNPDMVNAASSVFRAPPDGFSSAKVYIIGAGRTTPSVTTGSGATYTGPAQDLGVFATFLQVQ